MENFFSLIHDEIFSRLVARFQVNFFICILKMKNFFIYLFFREFFSRRAFKGKFFSLSFFSGLLSLKFISKMSFTNIYYGFFFHIFSWKWKITAAVPKFTQNLFDMVVTSIVSQFFLHLVLVFRAYCTSGKNLHLLIFWPNFLKFSIAPY